VSKIIIFAVYYGIILPSYVGTRISHYKDPYQQNKHNGMSLVGFDHCSLEKNRIFVGSIPASFIFFARNPCCLTFEFSIHLSFHSQNFQLWIFSSQDEKHFFFEIFVGRWLPVPEKKP